MQAGRGSGKKLDRKRARVLWLINLGGMGELRKKREGNTFWLISRAIIQTMAHCRRKKELEGRKG